VSFHSLGWRLVIVVNMLMMVGLFGGDSMWVGGNDAAGDGGARSARTAVVLIAFCLCGMID
jgi:hypothetical protein